MGGTELPATEDAVCTGHCTAVPGNIVVAILLGDYEVLCFQPANGSFCNVPPMGKKKPKGQHKGF